MAELEKDVVTAEVEAEAKPKRAKKTTAEKVEKEPKTTAKKTTKKADAEVETKEEKPAKKTATKAKKPAVKKDTTIQYLGTGRRKKSIARVRLLPGTGKFIVNKRTIEEYFHLGTLIQVAKQPLTLVGMENKFDVYVNVVGGGFRGQAGAVRLGVARALVEFDENLRKEIKKEGFLTRDARTKERKKYGLKKARKAPQFSKR